MMEKQAAASLQKAMIIQNMKKKTGRPDYNDNANTYFSPRKTVGAKGPVDKENVIVIGINAPEIIDGLSRTIEHPSKDMYKFVGTDTRGKTNLELASPPRIMGLISTNSHGPEYRGGYYANVQYREGSDKAVKYGTIIMQSGDERLRNTVSTIANIEDAIVKPKRGNKLEGYAVPDDSGYLNKANEMLQENARSLGLAGTGTRVGFVVKPHGDKINADVEVKLFNSKGKVVESLSPNDLQALGLNPKYSVKDIYSMAQDQLAAISESYVQTEKSLQENLNQ